MQVAELWCGRIMFVVGKSYKLCILIARTFKDKKYLSVPSEGFIAVVIHDIGVVESVKEEATERKYTQVYVEGVKRI